MLWCCVGSTSGRLGGASHVSWAPGRPPALRHVPRWCCWLRSTPCPSMSGLSVASSASSSTAGRSSPARSAGRDPPTPTPLHRKKGAQGGGRRDPSIHCLSRLSSACIALTFKAAAPSRQRVRSMRCRSSYTAQRRPPHASHICSMCAAPPRLLVGRPLYGGTGEGVIQATAMDRHSRTRVNPSSVRSQEWRSEMHQRWNVLQESSSSRLHR